MKNFFLITILFTLNILQPCHANTLTTNNSDTIKQKIIDRNKLRQQAKIVKEEKKIILKESETLLIETDEGNTIIEILDISNSFGTNSIGLKYYYQYKDKTVFSHTEWNHNSIESCKDDSWHCQEDGYISGSSTSTLRLPFLFGIVSIDDKNNTVELKLKSKKSTNITTKNVILGDYQIFNEFSLKENINIGKWEIRGNTIDLYGYEKLNSRYSKHPTYISFDGKKIDGADYNTFKAMGKYWGFDKNNLYEFGKAIDIKFDYETITTSTVFPFQTIPIDKNHAYFKEYNKKIMTISHQDYLETSKNANIEEVFKEREFKFDELGLNFPMNEEIDSKSVDINRITENKENIESDNYQTTDKSTYKRIIMYSFLLIILFISMIPLIKRRKKEKIKLHHNHD